MPASRLATETYSNNRADNSYIPGAVIPGYIIIKPDFPECIDDFGFLWFEDEAVVAESASWVIAGNAADAITKEAKQCPEKVIRRLNVRRMLLPTLPLLLLYFAHGRRKPERDEIPGLHI
ncbi:hypothetical protein [Pseudacidobacterium ailaaui]|jgi:hypothetical protein|uniref:hypothetical protein n=1 Tax=Pseudacidobacterium ailaaui TaxID=1382359 RepID=UPI00047D78B9|nr:hypothetical protein [Pseudacidobacterium ailaaui]